VQVLGHAERLFEDTRLSTDVQFSSFRRDAYQAVSFLNRDTPSDRLSETVEATTSDTLAAALELDAPLVRHLRLVSRLDFSVNNRLIRTLRAPDQTLFFDTDFNRRTIDLDLGVLYERRRLTTRVTLRGGAEVERRSLVNDENLPTTQASQKSTLLKQGDYDRGHLMLMVNSRAFLTRRVAAVFDGSASILRHDTPESNADDRDEVYYNGQFGVEMTLNRYLRADLKLFGTYYHTVYLKASRSAENNIQRSLRLRPSVRWTPSERTRIQASSEVRATYTVDDFLLPGRRPTDQAAREMRYDLNLEQDLGRGRVLRADGSLSDLRLGRFLDNIFAEIPFDTLRTYSGWVRLRAGRRTTAEVGLRFLIRSDYNRATGVRYPRLDETGAGVVDERGNAVRNTITRPGRERISQVGPTCALTWPMRRGTTLRIDGWFTFQRVRQRLYGGLPEPTAPLIRRAARDGTRTIIPNLSMRMEWRF
jgi:hypothetical protein